MPHLCIKARRVLTPQGWLANAQIITQGHQIAAIEKQPGNVAGHEVIETSLDLIPGLIDIHIHGWGGQRCQSAAGARAVAKSIAHHGATSFLPTLIGEPSFGELLDATADVASAVGPQERGAEVLGLHIEGPFLNPDPKVRGAQFPAHMRSPSVEELEQLEAAANHHLRYMTIAPELPGAEAVIRRAVELGIVMGAGHTAATFAQMGQARSWGIRSGIHTFNGMTGLHHREPGVAGAILLDSDLVAEVIADGVHVALPVVELLIRCKGADRVALITDAVQLAGLPDGEYKRPDGRTVLKQGQRAFIEGNHLAGSVTGLDQNLRHVAALSGVGLENAVRMASEVPAKLIGVWDRKGSLELHKDADLIGLDSEGQVRLVMIRGEVVSAQS